MPIRRDATRGPAVLILLIMLAFLASGCEVSVEEPQGTTGPQVQHIALTSSVEALPAYDAAVSAIDFDPPLRRENLQSTNKPVKLLAAIENRGTMALTRLVVEARLVSQKGDFNTQSRATIARLAPGEVSVVEFEGMSPVTTLPRSPSYSIQVSVGSQQQDAQPQNNHREVVVRVLN